MQQQRDGLASEPAPTPDSPPFRYPEVIVITLELRPGVEARLQLEAEAKGLSVGKSVEKLVEEHTVATAMSPKTSDEVRERLMKLARRWHELPTLDRRSPDEIIGYDQNGLPSR